jgi:hypothetical protein
MKAFYVRLKSLSNLASEVQEIKASDGHRAFIAGGNAAANWGKGNASESVRWWVETFSGKEIGNGKWDATPAKEGGE